MVSLAGCEIWLPAQLLIAQQKLPSFNFCALEMVSVELSAPGNLPVSHIRHSSMLLPSPAGFHCHW